MKGKINTCRSEHKQLNKLKNAPMKFSVIAKLFLVLVLFFYSSSSGYSKTFSHRKTIEIEWNKKVVNGYLTISNGKIGSITILKGKGKIEKHRFQVKSDNVVRIRVSIEDAHTGVGPGSTVVSVEEARHPFSFFLRDVNTKFPVYIPLYEVVVLEEDNRSYQEIAHQNQLAGLATKVQSIEHAPECSFDQVKDQVRNMSVPVLLGLGRDMRMFEIYEELNDNDLQGKIIKARHAMSTVSAYIYALGRGVGPLRNISRHLEDGNLPIYHSSMIDDDVRYHSVSFVSPEKSDLSAYTVEGTHYMISDYHSSGRVFSEEQKKMLEEKLQTGVTFSEELVLHIHTTITNTGKVPRYAWFKVPMPGTNWYEKHNYRYDGASGFASFSDDQLFCIATLNGKPVPNEEMAVLLLPGEEIHCSFLLPHKPISRSRALALVEQDEEKHFHAAKAYWKGKLQKGASMQVPEMRVQQMLEAGLLHLDLITFGQDPDGVLAPNVGGYSPIGTESSPIIQFYLSMGWTDEARRSLDYFYATQQPDGSVRNYGGYMVETGAVLWTTGEYFRYTRDKDWIIERKEQILNACNYLIKWRERNKQASLKGRGYGMLDGKVADPEDPFRQFMLNAYAYLGLKRTAEVLKDIDPKAASILQKEVEEWKTDILETVHHLIALSPVVPLGDGSWVPTLPPWAEANAPRALYNKAEAFWSHATFTVADALLGPLYLVFCELIAPDSKMSEILLSYTRELFLQGNAAISQPYYSRHNWLQLKRGEVKPFLNTYYTTIAAHADRETYSFWEHMYRVSSHKTHEEAWFLMETRWMLYLEEGDTLLLFKTIPRKWLEKGKEIKLEGVRSYFGKLDVEVKADLKEDIITASISCMDVSKPAKVIIRLPHPEHKKPVKVTGGDYDEQTEAVTISSFGGKAEVIMQY
jgi:hypothetical protein